MTEETDALNARIRVLENQVADMQRLVQDTSDLLDIARANGLDKFLTGHGFWQSQGGIMQFDQHGIQITPTSSQNVALFFISAFSTDPASQNGVGTLVGDIFSNYADIGISAKSPDGTASIGLTCLAHNTATSQYIQANGAPFWMPVTAIDYAANQDGMLWYRSDTDKFRARINGATENLATESYVAANAPTGFADAFLVMGG